MVIHTIFLRPECYSSAATRALGMFKDGYQILICDRSVVQCPDSVTFVSRNNRILNRTQELGHIHDAPALNSLYIVQR